MPAANDLRQFSGALDGGRGPSCVASGRGSGQRGGANEGRSGEPIFAKSARSQHEAAEGYRLDTRANSGLPAEHVRHGAMSAVSSTPHSIRHRACPETRCPWL